MMAGMSGWEFRAAQLENPSSRAIPVVVLTAANTLTDGVHTLSDVEVLAKPFELDTLLAVVGRYAAGHASLWRLRTGPRSAWHGSAPTSRGRPVGCALL